MYLKLDLTVTLYSFDQMDEKHWPKNNSSYHHLMKHTNGCLPLPFTLFKEAPKLFYGN